MADTDERLTLIQEFLNKAEGYVSDADFREEYESRVLRYNQAMCALLLAQCMQNQIFIELLQKQLEYRALSE
jgi:hypothetical protein